MRGNEYRERTCEFGKLLKLFHKSCQIQRYNHRFLWFFRMMDIIQVGIEIERCFKFLCVDFSAIVPNMRVHACNHIDLHVSCVVLYLFPFAKDIGKRFRLFQNDTGACVLRRQCENMGNIPFTQCFDCLFGSVH